MQTQRHFEPCVQWFNKSRHARGTCRGSLTAPKYKILQICVCVWTSNANTVKFIGIYHKWGKTERGRGKEILMCWWKDHPICTAGDVLNKYCICLLPLTWHWKSLINLRNNDLCSKHVESNHICLYHKFWIKCFRAFLKAMSLEHVGKRLLLMSSSVSERCGKGIVGCSCKVISCTTWERWSS